jgi:c-di-GMP-binding flagellar brake protein YcgR
MSAPQDLRKFPRLSISGGNYGVRFQAQGIEVLDTRLVNLSAGGCGLEVQIADARAIEMGEILESLYLDHPDLPLVPLSAVVLRILGKVAGKTTGYVLLGLEFQEITPFIQQLIDEHVAAEMSPE